MKNYQTSFLTLFVIFTVCVFLNSQNIFAMSSYNKSKFITQFTNVNTTSLNNLKIYKKLNYSTYYNNALASASNKYNRIINSLDDQMFLEIRRMKESYASRGLSSSGMVSFEENQIRSNYRSQINYYENLKRSEAQSEATMRYNSDQNLIESTNDSAFESNKRIFTNIDQKLNSSFDVFLLKQKGLSKTQIDKVISSFSDYKFNLMQARINNIYSNTDIYTAKNEINDLFANWLEEQNVLIPLEGIKMKRNQLTLKLNTSSIIGISLIPQNSTFKGLIWSSGNSNIVSVDKYGRAVGKKIGTTKITVKSIYGGYKSVVTIQVVR